MSEAPKAGATNKWTERASWDIPTVVVGRRALKRRLKAVVVNLKLATSAERNAEHIHQLRVATRRTASVARLLNAFARKQRWNDLRDLLRQIRRSAANARRADVHLEYFQTCRDSDAERADDYQKIIEYVTQKRNESQRELRHLADKDFLDRLARVERRILRELAHPKPLATDDPRALVFTLGQLTGEVLPALIRPISHADQQSLTGIEAIHELRLKVKRLRYSLEILAGALPTRLWMEVRPLIESLQERLGALNDADEILGTATSALGGENNSTLLKDLQETRDQAKIQFLDWWSGSQGEELKAVLNELAQRSCDPVSVSTSVDANLAHHRIAALDVGTNSVRLVVAETDPKRGFRVIEDSKESCRLGGGMFADGRLTDAAMKRTAEAIARLKANAERHHIEAIRAIGTAAVREATNQRDFLNLVEETAGISLQVIDAEYEARLAFASVANAIDLSRRRVAVVDIGGGSTQVITSVGGLIDDIFPLKMGAVRLTERFAHLIDDPVEQYAEMRRAATEIVHRSIPRAPSRTETLVGVGGTCNNLGRLAMRNGAAMVGGGRFLFAVSGCELPYVEVVRILDWLRRLTPAERSQIAGISQQRADIIVAGAIIIERVMDRLGVDRLQVHDGGVRDGLIAEMIDELGLTPAPDSRRPADAIKAARDFASRACEDRPHAEHVARLSLHLFDGLARINPDAMGAWASPDARLMLEIGAILHDCGITIDYRSHHRHGHDMVLHAELPTLTRREREIIALLARYHRKRGPNSTNHAFKQLSAGDQRLVAHLAGILRIADGLDRCHDQQVLQVQAQRKKDRIVIRAHAHHEPTVGMLAARKKGDLFRRAFRIPVELEWVPTRTPVATDTAQENRRE